MRAKRLARSFTVLIALLLAARIESQAPAEIPSRIPLCTGLTIVTAVNQHGGDYESIKTIESTAGDVVRLKYSVERKYFDRSTGWQLQKLTMRRGIRREDLRTGSGYLQEFNRVLPEVVPGTTSIGTSAAVLTALKTKGEADLGIWGAVTGTPSLDRDTHPSVYDFQTTSKIRRVGSGTVSLPVLLNGVRVQLPTIHARGEHFGEPSEFFFYDDPSNPFTLKFRLGIGGLPALPEHEARIMGIPPRPAGGDRGVLQVVKIDARCAGTSSTLESTLSANEPAEIYDIYFSFNSDSIREESEPRLREIAGVMRKHPPWKLAVQGHTDGIGTDAANLDLSQRRSAAVKQALVQRYGIDATRLTTGGSGESQPRDTNATIEGRAKNRRVELTRH